MLLRLFGALRASGGTDIEIGARLLNFGRGRIFKTPQPRRVSVFCGHAWMQFSLQRNGKKRFHQHGVNPLGIAFDKCSRQGLPYIDTCAPAAHSKGMVH